MEDQKTQCPKCGSEKFWLREDYLWECWTADDEIICKHPQTELKEMLCWECGAEIEDYDLDKLNFQ